MKPYPDYGTGKYVCRCPAVVPNNTQGWTKVNTDPVKVGTKDNRPGIVKVPKPGKILKFKLVHVCGGISCSYRYPLTHFGCHQSFFGLFITDTTKQVLSPKLKHQHASFYSIPGSTPYDAEFTLPEMSPTLNVANQQELQIWYGEDAFNHYETDNFGIVQIDLYCYYI
ncbi:uncharacterized protein LOC110246107 isoform X1 [Exaiptasia diaphana]|uniref:Uncharacterized protein n=1 Tax=Exaiptasia diaphana TaxID=2652724 RepID=A0A913XPE6_EXADI|nr:uncharacterized protein LOC110246107 isoform X1 [Exaiptasia diaphana]